MSFKPDMFVGRKLAMPVFWMAQLINEESLHINHGLQDKCVVSTCVEFNLYCTMLKHFHTSLIVICIICMLKHSPHL